MEEAWVPSLFSLEPLPVSLALASLLFPSGWALLCLSQPLARGTEFIEWGAPLAFAHILLQSGHSRLPSLLSPRSPLCYQAGQVHVPNSWQDLFPVFPLQAAWLQSCRQPPFHADLLWFFSDLAMTHVDVKICGPQACQSRQTFHRVNLAC